MPTHNRADVIASAIESVLAQTVENWELFVVGDGCTDNTEAVVRKYVKQDSRIIWLPFPKGPGFGYGHRNVVLKRARGRYIAFAAHDDLWIADHLQTHLDFFATHREYAIAYTRPLWVHPEGMILPSSYNTDNPSTFESFMTTHNEIPADCVVHTRQAMEQVGYWNAQLPVAADWDLWKRIIQKSKTQRIGFISTPTTLHFRANWRTEQNSWSDHMRVLYDSFAREGQTKQRFAIPFKPGVPIQKLAWESMHKKVWVEKLRSHSVGLIDARVQEALTLEREIVNLQQEVNGTLTMKLYQLARRIKRLVR